MSKGCSPCEGCIAEPLCSLGPKPLLQHCCCPVLQPRVLSDCFHMTGFNLNTIYIFQKLFSNLLRLFYILSLSSSMPPVTSALQGKIHQVYSFFRHLDYS